MFMFPWAYTFYHNGKLLTVFSRLPVDVFEEKYDCWVWDMISVLDIRD